MKKFPMWKLFTAVIFNDTSTTSSVPFTSVAVEWRQEFGQRKLQLPVQMDGIEFFLAEPTLAMFTSTGSLRPNPKEPRSALVSSFFVRTFMLLSYGSKTFRMFITSCLFRWSRCIVAATISSPGTSGGKKNQNQQISHFCSNHSAIDTA